MIKKYRKKPVVIEAVQWIGNSLGEFIEFLRVNGLPLEWKIGFRGEPVYYSSTGDINREAKGKLGIIIPTLEGDMVAEKGDYIIKEPFPTNDRQFYPCKPDIFEQTYEEVLS